MIRVDELSVETLLEKTWFFELFTYGIISYGVKHIMVPLVKDKNNEGQVSYFYD